MILDMTEQQFREWQKRIEDRLIRYTKNLDANGHPEAACAVAAVLEAFTQEIISYELAQKK